MLFHRRTDVRYVDRMLRNDRDSLLLPVLQTRLQQRVYSVRDCSVHSSLPPSALKRAVTLLLVIETWLYLTLNELRVSRATRHSHCAVVLSDTALLAATGRYSDSGQISTPGKTAYATITRDANNSITCYAVEFSAMLIVV